MVTNIVVIDTNRGSQTFAVDIGHCLSRSLIYFNDSLFNEEMSSNIWTKRSESSVERSKATEISALWLQAPVNAPRLIMTQKGSIILFDVPGTKTNQKT